MQPFFNLLFMKKTLLTFIFTSITLITFSQVSWLAGTPEETESATIVFDATGTGLENTAGIFYAHTGATINDTDHWQNVIGSWGNNVTQPAFTLQSGNIYHLVVSPTIADFYSNPTGTITGIDLVVRSFDGGSQSLDLALAVGAFQVSLLSPTENSTSIVTSGANFNITAQNTNGSADYNLIANGVSVHTTTTAFYTRSEPNITSNQNYELQVTQSGKIISKFFSVAVDPGTISEAMPAGMENGINYDAVDATIATLVLDAPLKDFVHVAGSFNNYSPTAAYTMKTDPGTGKFWLTLTGLTSGQIENYQYWVYATNPVAGSPSLVKTADPFSTLVLSPFDDPYIPSVSYPNIPTYPAGQEREVTVLQTGQTAYNWQVTNFAKPKKEDLVIYEVLVRDFDGNRNFQDLIDKIDYFKNLNVNAIELMPIMEYEGNESWGYNTSFHLALDKFYGTEDKFREFVDVCHQNGIAVILDLALNHAFGRNPMNRMWMDDPDGNGWGEPSSENPYMNQVATHSYSVGSDYNHQQTRTQYYTERVVKHWIEEFKIDGFRWDLTKGFTQNCTAADENCTNTYQPDRVAILQQYADYSWSIDPDHYVIFEHLGTDNEEKEWANYRLNEGKGIMMWSKITSEYNELTMGQSGNKDFSRVGYKAHAGFTSNRVIGYPESHDEERLMYKNLQFGNSSNGSHNVKNLNTALSRMSALGAVYLTVPGPKMIWHFAELGMENSIFTCNNGSYDNDGCKLDTKPQPQWTNNWLNDATRSQIYNDWGRLNFLKTNEDVFEGDYSITAGTLTPKIYVWDNAIAASELKNVVILANFDVTTQNVVPNFPYTGDWYDLMDNSGTTFITVANTATTISIAAGQFKIYGNKAAQGLSVEEFDISNSINLYPNPTNGSFSINKNADKIELFDLAGRRVKSFTNSISNTPLNISNLSNGMYFVKITTMEGIGTKRLIKQ